MLKNEYFNFILTVLITTSILIIISISFIMNNTFVSEKADTYEKAFLWQESNKGVVGITSKIANIYKTKMADWYVSHNDVDILLLGSSTLMGIKSDMFDNHILFNGAKNGNPLIDSISKAKYYAKSSQNIKYIIIGFDWALGKPYRKYRDINYNPKLNYKEPNIKFYTKVKDAVSYQRVKIVLLNIYNSFLDSSNHYKCPTENNIGTDKFFKTDSPKRCHGFRFDGSATFENQNILTENKWKNYLKGELKNYRKHLTKSLGEFDSRYLDDFKKIDDILKNKGGKLIIYIPPLMPKATLLIEKSKEGIYLKTTIDKLSTYLKNNDIDFLDASKSEDFGCIYSDFMDVHHSFPSGHSKIIKSLSFE